MNRVRFVSGMSLTSGAIECGIMFSCAELCRDLQRNACYGKAKTELRE